MRRPLPPAVPAFGQRAAGFAGSGRALAALLGLVLLAPTVAAAEKASPPAPAGATLPAPARATLPAPAGWAPLELPGVDRASEYQPLQEPAGAVRARSHCAASALVASLEEVDLVKTPVLRWRWQVLKEPGTTDERSKPGDDFAARVYVMFEFEPERASFLDRARRAIGEALYGTVPGSALNYVWSRTIPAGEAWKNPFVAESRMISLGRGELGTWREVEVDVLDDYERLFGRPPPRAIGVALMSDSDNSCSESEALLDGFALLPRAR